METEDDSEMEGLDDSMDLAVQEMVDQIFQIESEGEHNDTDSEPEPASSEMDGSKEDMSSVCGDGERDAAKAERDADAARAERDADAAKAESDADAAEGEHANATEGERADAMVKVVPSAMEDATTALCSEQGAMQSDDVEGMVKEVISTIVDIVVFSFEALAIRPSEIDQMDSEPLRRRTTSLDAASLQSMKAVRLRAVLELFAICIGVTDDNYNVCKDALEHVARSFELDQECVTAALNKGAEQLDFSQWDGFASSLAITITIISANPESESAETLFWLVFSVIRQGLWRPYDARVRAGLRRIAQRLKVPWRTVSSFEMAVMSGEDMQKQSQNQKVQRTLKEHEGNISSRWQRTAAVTAAATVGAGVLAATGILALPAVGAALAGLGSATGVSIFGSAAAAVGTASGAALTGSTLGAAGAGLVGSKMYRRTGGIKQFDFKDQSTQMCSRAAVTIAISGWVTKRSDFTELWMSLSSLTHEEVNCLIWEEKELTDLGSMLVNFLYDQATGAAMELVIKRTVLHGLFQAAVWPATVVGAAGLIDNEWSVAMNRANDGGQLLAEILMRNIHGYRPVSLIGFSLGARVIFNALDVLDKANRLDIVENVVLLGAPIGSYEEEWRRIRVVAGRIISVYNPTDWVLYFVFRGTHLKLGVAGLQPVKVRRVENVSLQDDLKIQGNYRDQMDAILHKLNLYSK